MLTIKKEKPANLNLTQESIESILPICDEVIVLVGDSEDNTLELIQSIHSDKIKIYDSIWDNQLREGGRVLAVETNKALKLVNPEADWCFYIQADEVLHEKYIPQIREVMKTYLRNRQVEGLLFAYKHFFGNFNYQANSRNYYRNEIRIIRNDHQIQSYRDAQGFRKNGKKLKVKQTGCEMYHYGWVRYPDIMQEKIKNFHQLWHSDEWIAGQENLNREFNYNEIDLVEPYTGTHPACMKERTELKNWDFIPDVGRSEKNLKKKLLTWFEKKTGIRIGEYQNYQLI